jgi:hypothetical protein
VLADSRKPVTGRQTRLRPYIARNAFERPEISFAQ